MKDIFISIESVVKYKKGDRVVVNFGTKKEPEYYIGTVTRSGIKVSVLFDDGDKGSFPAKSNKLVGIGIKKKRKSEIPVKQIIKWVVKKSASKTSKPVKNTPLCEKWFQKHLFSDNLSKPSKEKNTSTEDKIWDELKNYVENTKPVKPKFIKMLVECKDKFKKYLTPKHKIAYRGLVLNFDLEKFQTMKRKLVKSKYAPKHGLYEFQYTYTPGKSVESWTVDFKVAVHFVTKNHVPIKHLEEHHVVKSYRHQCPVILKTRVDDSFFMSPKLINTVVDETNINNYEHEIFKLGEEKIKVKAYMSKKVFDFLTT
jgi:hypothetical protein